MANRKVRSEVGGAVKKVGFTDTRRVKELVELMTEAGLTEMELAEGASRIMLRKGGVAPVAHVPMMAAPAPVATPSPGTGGGAVPGLTPSKKEGGEDETLIAIKSPMVGTFYASPNPESDAFVTIGTDVEKEQSIVCIIEAMKVFNEIHADVTGTVVKILASNGQAVEYGQPLFMVRPA
ncbi:MAG: acetyl-CoA carboxylase biotin carboxyl carrier protein [Phycisphaerales bacterium]|nr:acetyl-CoA carboxylase biotin carboxyl carrier protein [Phycisphaerales bacterium]